MSQQDILIIIAFVAIRALAQLEPRRPYEPPGPVAVAFLIAFEVIAGAAVCALIAAAAWFLVMRR